MRNLYAFAFVTVFLAACGTYTWQNTHARQTLVPSMPADAWTEYVQHGGAFRGR